MNLNPRANLMLSGLSCAVFLGIGATAWGQGQLPPVGSPGGPARALTPVEAEQWLRGRALFDEPMHRSRGLGLPHLNADSCRACHQDPVIGGAGGLELNVARCGNDNGGAGPFMDVAGGQAISKLFPPYVPGREEHDPTAADVYEQRQTPSILGGGLIDSILDAEILMNQDLTDVNIDGIFGVARKVTVPGGPDVGRFGWKAQIPHMLDFVRDASGGELGLTTPVDGRGFAFASDGDAAPDPELTLPEVEDMAFFLTELAPPQRTNPTDPAILNGEFQFGSVGCATCHIPTLQGASGPVPLYSNLLLHNVMPANFRGMSEPGAGVGFYRTPPLWGIRDTAPYMHDGRAEDLAGAIAAHEGEAELVRQAYEALSPLNQADLLSFLNDL